MLYQDKAFNSSDNASKVLVTLRVHLVFSNFQNLSIVYFINNSCLVPFSDNVSVCFVLRCTRQGTEFLHLPAKECFLPILSVPVRPNSNKVFRAESSASLKVQKVKLLGRHITQVTSNTYFILYRTHHRQYWT